MFSIVALLLVACVQLSHQGPHERRLLDHLFNGSGYNKLERPVVKESDALNVSFGLVLQQIIDVDEKNQVIHTNMWLNMQWKDYSLSWNESLYGGVASIRVPPANIWKPDILMYNSADEDIDSTFPTNVVVSSGGDCLWVPPGLFRSTCKIDITWFPFDEQRCSMKFGSWTYDSSGINLQLQGDSGDTSSFIPNGEWLLIGMPAKRNVVTYECCPEQYIDITFSIHIRRRTLFYGFNLIIPCVLISSMALLTFMLPPEAGEKISLGVTILLSLTVFLLLVAEAMPPTSDAVPLIGMYFACIMLMCSLSVVFTVLVLNFHHRSPEMHNMPNWVKKVVCVWLARIVLMSRSPADIKGTGLSSAGDSRTIQPRSGVESSDLELGQGRRTAFTNGGIIAVTVKPSPTFRMSPSKHEIHYPKWEVGSTRVPREIHSSSASPSRSRYFVASPTDEKQQNESSSLDSFCESRSFSAIPSTSSPHPAICGSNTSARFDQPQQTGEELHQQRRKTPQSQSKDSSLVRSNADGYVTASFAADISNVSSAWSSPETWTRRIHVGEDALPAPLTHNHIQQQQPNRRVTACIPTADHEPDSGKTVSSSLTTRPNILATYSQPSATSRQMVPTVGGFDGMSSGGGLSTTAQLLKSILGEMRMLTGKLRSDDERETQCSDWKFAAKVIDRVCLVMFTIFTVVSTFAIIFAAPHVIA